MKKLVEILTENFPGVDFEKETQLVTNGILDSVEIVTLISEIEDVFGITISMEYIKPENFESISSMEKMIKELT